MKNFFTGLIFLLLSMTTAFAQESENYCLAKAIYFEARSQSIDGQTAVADVILNRKADPLYPKNVCEVVYQKCQFSWHCQKGVEYDPEKLADDRRKYTWQNIKTLANTILLTYNTNNYNDLTGGAVNFHAVTINPHWKHVKKTIQIGEHVFYKRI
jgi:spore germination cell wall hydrolase CwlJ-like protein